MKTDACHSNIEIYRKCAIAIYQGTSALTGKVRVDKFYFLFKIS